MSKKREAPAERARQLVGRKFRPQGRNPELGLDCLGLAARAFDVPQQSVPSDYRLRGNHLAALLEGIGAYFRRIPIARAERGDMLLCAVAADQHHLVIKTNCGFIHADAGLRRVVETPASPPWPILAAFRRRRES